MSTTQHLYTFTTLIAVLFTLPLTAAAQTTIINTTSASSNSGGNSASGGQVVEGESSNSVYSQTIINGEVVESYSETSGEPIYYESTHTSSDGGSRSYGSLQVNTSNMSSDSNTSVEQKSEVEVRAAADGATTQNATTAATSTETAMETEATTSADVALAGESGIWISIKAAVSSFFAYVSKWF